MDFERLHGWDMSAKEAAALQSELRGRVELRPLPKKIERVAGADISFNRFSNVVYAGFVVVELPSLEVVATAGVKTEATFPYVPGLLSFRESPPLLEAWAKLDVRPDVIVADGQGIAHPRRFGVASHLGLLTGVPSIGCAKSVLVGKYEEPDPTAGSHAPLVDKGETIGEALRTKDRVAPVFVSVGTRATLETARRLLLRCVRGFEAPEPPGRSRSRYRIPEPTRLAHLYVNALRRGEEWTPPA